MTGLPIQDRHRIEEFLAEVRPFLEERWCAWKRDRIPDAPACAPSLGMCRFTCAFLLPLMIERFPAADAAAAVDRRRRSVSWRVAAGMSDFHPADDGWLTGRGKPPSSWRNDDGIGGMRTVAGVWRDHYWLVRSDGVLADVTADQFGHETIIVSVQDDLRYLENWKPAWAAEHLKEVAGRAADWRRDWQAAQEAVSGYAAMR